MQKGRLFRCASPDDAEAFRSREKVSWLKQGWKSKGVFYERQKEARHEHYL